MVLRSIVLLGSLLSVAFVRLCSLDDNVNKSRILRGKNFLVLGGLFCQIVLPL